MVQLDDKSLFIAMLTLAGAFAKKQFGETFSIQITDSAGKCFDFHCDGSDVTWHPSCKADELPGLPWSPLSPLGAN